VKGGEMRFSKLLAFVLIMVLVGSVALVACGGDNGTPTNGDNDTAVEDTTTPDNNGEVTDGGEEETILTVEGLESNVKLEIGDEIPDLAFKLHPVSWGLESSIWSYMEENEAEALVLDFWAVWCEPCKEELPHLEVLQRKFADKGLVVLGATIDPYDAEATIYETLQNDGKMRKSWKALKNYEITSEEEYLVNFDVPVDGEREMAKALGVTSIPRTFLITKDHKLYYQHTGFDLGKVAELEEKVAELLGE